MITIEEIFPYANLEAYPDKAFACIKYIALMAEKRFDTFLEPFNISPQQYRILFGLSKGHPEGVPIYTLGKFLADPKSDTSRMVTRMQRAGWVIRQKDANDKRATNAVITPKGLELLAEIDRNIYKIGFETTEMTEENARQLYNMLMIWVDAFYTGLPLRT